LGLGVRDENRCGAGGHFWGASGRWFKSSRPDHLKPAASEEKSEGPRASSFPVPDGLTASSPSTGPDRSPVELLRSALASIDGGVIRIGDLRKLLVAALDALDGEGQGR